MGEAPTIFALSSALGRAGIAVVRVSGPRAGPLLDLVAPPRPSPRYAAARHLRHPETGERVDYGLALWFPAPASFTGEDVAELHLHGGRAVVRAVLGALGQIPGCRLAEAGEFARRAFGSPISSMPRPRRSGARRCGRRRAGCPR
jgi:tRNA modification GTPase